MIMLGTREIGAYFNGHYYANKAPGLSLLAVPVWIATNILLPSTTTLDARAWWTNVFVNALPASLLDICLFVTLGWLEFLRFTRVSERRSRMGSGLWRFRMRLHFMCITGRGVWVCQFCRAR